MTEREIYDMLLTQAEIQGNISAANGTFLSVGFVVNLISANEKLSGRQSQHCKLIVILAVSVKQHFSVLSKFLGSQVF